MGSDLSVVRAARVSYNADWRSGEDAGKDEKLISYLLNNKHNTPFEMVEFVFEVKAPIFVFRQWHRHRTWSYNEVSARYTELDEGFYVPDPKHIGTQSKSSKQSRDIDPNVHQALDGAELHAHRIKLACESAFKTYKWLIEEGVPRELARSVLPVSAYSRMFAKIDLHNLMGFLRLRLHPHAQYEIRVYAQAMLELIEPICPVTIGVFKAQMEKQP
jgi:thymidylate synthase (FAD)